jgi:hypothetical protein
MKADVEKREEGFFDFVRRQISQRREIRTTETGALRSE